MSQGPGGSTTESDLVRALPDAVIVLDATGVALEFNQRAALLYRESRELRLGERPGLPTAEGHYPDFVITDAAAGRVVDLEVVSVPWRGGTALLARLRDTTEHKRLWDRLHEASKIEAIGRLAGGVAHDFNNLLSVIDVCCDLLNTEHNLATPARELVEDVRLSGRRAAALTTKLLAFGQQAIFTRTSVQLSSVVKELESVLRRLITENISLCFDLEPEPGFVLVDVAQLETILLELASNAQDAMPRGGELRIATSTVDAIEVDAHGVTTVPPGRYGTLVVEDSGVGMSKVTRQRAFEPFFTTKETGRSTGLGLASIYGMVQQLRGYIGVDSDLGRGTTIRIYLPESHRTATEPQSAGFSAASASGRRTILLVEDEDSLRRLFVIFLESQGYEVLVASDGVAGVEAARSHPGTIHAIVTDLVMPRMGGRELVATVRESRPEVKVLYMSGYAANTDGEETAANRGDLFLQKPLSPQQLSTQMNTLLAELPPGE